ncbi:cytochrome C [Nitrosospira lacus]|uniref:Cytochrome C n=1 Tax=Nitrosospira lacus TaxID=1288494 RepID=A0A1W6SPW3_9PROT|nr:cytochrome c [Nitrosospira lacus]ARO87812.1 cytochrome C [Nitrosospira lacus]
MRKIKAGGAVSGFLLVMTIASGTMANAAWAAPPEAPGAGFSWKDGAEVYAKVCGYCHDAQVGPVIRGRALPAAYIHAVVRNGNRAMPAFRPSEIDNQSLAKLAEYISKN